MIRVRKAAKPPKKLATDGVALRDAMTAAYDGDPSAYRNGKASFQFNGKVYGHATVKNALKKAQHGKCVFCESKVDHVAHGDVEHFRPKAGYRQGEKDPLGKPGYYWLAYEWSNLFFSCQLCNQRHKGNLFPLEDPKARALCHADDPGREQPLFVDPGAEDPERYLSFRDEIPFAVKGNLRGKTTIAKLGIDREPLNERRRERLALLRAWRAIAALLSGEPEATEAEAGLQSAILDSAPYAAMARAFL